MCNNGGCNDDCDVCLVYHVCFFLRYDLQRKCCEVNSQQLATYGKRHIEKPAY